MYEVLQKTIESLSTAQLEDIYTINKLNIQGFRIKGPSSQSKTKRMRSQLANSSKIEILLKKTAEEYRKQKDYSWALASSVNTEDVRRKIEESNVGEVAYALILSNKLSLLKDILIPTINDNELNENNEEVNNGNDVIIKNLRGIIGDLEEKNKILNDSLKVAKDELISLTKNNRELKKLYKESKEDLTRDYQNIKKQYEEVTAELMKSKGVIGNLQVELKQIKKDNEKSLKEIESLDMALNKFNVLFYGTNIYKRYIDAKLSTVNNLSYDFYYSIDEIETFSHYQKLVILAFTLNQTEIQEIQENKCFDYFQDLFNVVYIASLEELNEYIIKVGRYYE